MESTTRVHVVFAVCDAQQMLVYGEERLRHIVADGEPQQLSGSEIPIGRPESAQVLEAVFADYPDLTVTWSSGWRCRSRPWSGVWIAPLPWPLGATALPATPLSTTQIIKNLITGYERAFRT